MSRKTRKLIWAGPLVAVFAVVGALALFMALQPNDAAAQANVEIPPGQPVGLTAEAYVDGTEQEEIQLDWSEPTDGGSVRFYRIDFSDNGGYTWVALESDVRGTSYTHDDLLADETYHYRVFALNQHGISVVSDVVSGTTEESWEPERPDDLRAVVGGSGPIADTASDLEITLTWDAPVDPDGAPVKSYEVQYSVDGNVWDPVPEVKKSGQKHTMLTEDLDTLEAGVGYQYRVRAKNSVGNSKWSSTAKAETAPGAIPGQPDTTAFTPGVAPVELNTWLFWEPPDDPLGDAITGYEVVGRPIKVAGPRLFGGPPARLASLGAVLDGPDTDDDGAGDDTDTDNNLGSITIAGIHINSISLGRDAADTTATTTTDHADDDDTVFDFDDVASRLEDAIQAPLTTTAWAGATEREHPLTLLCAESDIADLNGDGDTTDTFYCSTKKDVPATVDPDVDGNADTTPDRNYWDIVDVSHLNTTAATVRYTGLRFVLYIPRAGDDLAPALKNPSSVGSPKVANLLGWTGGSGHRSDPEFKCCPVPAVAEVAADPSATPPVEAADAVNAMPGWKVVKTDLDRPNATDINQFLVTTKDISGTGYSSQWRANIDWQFRVRALNRRAPANATAAEVMVEGATAAQNNLEASWSEIINARPGSDSALQRPEDLTIKRSPDDHDGRTGLILTWDKATTVPDSDGDSVDAAAYRVEYSDTGLQDAGYDWKVLEDIEVPDDVSENQQMFTDRAGVLSASDTLHAGQTRHYRVFALDNTDPVTNRTTATPVATTATGATGNDSVTVALGAQMSWPSPQEFGGTADPLKPEEPQRLRVTEEGHTHIDLVWTAPDASNDDNDGSEEGSSVIKEYILETSDDGGDTWTRRIDYDDETGKEIKITGTSYTDTELVPGQTRDYRVLAVNSSHMSIWSNTVAGTTQEAVLPNEPGGLTAESAGPTSIKLCWNTQAEQPEDAPVTEYVIEYSDDGKTKWTELAKVNDYTHDKKTVMKKGEEVEIEVNKQVYTIHTDPNLMPGQTRHYRVFARNLRGLSDQSDVATATTPDANVPDAPTGVTATVDSDTMVTVNWMASADPDGAPVTGYKVMWKMSSVADYADADMATAAADATMHQVSGLTPSTEYTFKVVATNAKGDSAAAEATETTDRSNAAPVAGDAIADQMVTAGETVDVDVSGNFSDPDEGDTLSYGASSSDESVATVSVSGSTVTVMGESAGPATITVTATDTGNMAGMLSVSQMFDVTVVSANTDPVAVGTIPAQTITAGEMSDAITLGDYFSDADMDALTYTQMSSDSAVATAMIDVDDSDPGATVHTLTIEGHMAGGPVTITVTASDGMGGMDATQTISVTVEAAIPDLVPPMITRTNPVGSGIVLVSWDSVPGATGYSLIAANLTDPSAPTRTAAADADDVSGQIQNLAAGDEYLIFVGAFNEDLEFELSDYVKIEAE